MPWYRLYHLNSQNGHVDRAEEIFAADDVAATYDLQQRKSDHPLELWEERRKVVYVDAHQPTAPKTRAGGVRAAHSVRP
jgi:hypothetical protein